MSLWNDTFRIEIKVIENPYQDRKEEFTLYFKGSLKGAIRSVFNGGYRGNVVAVFYDSKGNFLKEIGY